jgi:hypothetical protein
VGINTCQLHCQAVIRDQDTSYIRLLHLLKEKDFFHLEHQLNLRQQRLNPEQQLYFQAYLDNAFNRNKEAVRTIDSLLNNFSSSLSDSAKAALYLLRSDSYFKLFQYANAAQDDSIVLGRYVDVLDRNKVEEVKNMFIIYNGLKTVPPQQVFITQTAILPWKRNKLGIAEIPVKWQQASYDAVFDTRANISTIIQTYAAKLHLRPLPVFYYEGSGITGIRFKTSLAVADSLKIGNILVRHAVFQVVPDSVLYIAPVDFQINVIIGFPIIEQLSEVHFYKDGRMKIPARASTSHLHNLALDGLNPVISLQTGSGDTLCFALDFGASRSMLFAAYFQKYRQAVLAQGVKTTTQYGGAGGIQKKEVLTLPSVELFLGNKKVVLDSVDVLSEKIFAGETFYGNIGQDFIGQFHQLILNFREMYIKGL